MSATALEPEPAVALGIPSRKPSRFLEATLITLVVFLVVTVLMHFWLMPRWNAPAFKTQYQAVLLSNGAIYFGKLSRTWSDYPVLSDVYYLQSVTDNGTKETKSVLVKRGKEWHGPDHMVLNGRNIVLIEPVGENSKVAQLIAESKQQ